MPTIESCLRNTYTVHVNGIPKCKLWGPGSISLQDFGGLSVVNFSLFLRIDEESVDVVFEQKLVPVTAVASFGLVEASQTVQSCP